MSGDCDKCEKLLQGYLDRELSEDEVEVAQIASRRVRLLPAPVPLRGVAAGVRAHDRGRADAARADGEARAAPHDRSRRVRSAVGHGASDALQHSR